MLTRHMSRKLMCLGLVFTTFLALPSSTIGSKQLEQKSDNATSSRNAQDLSATTWRGLKLESKGHSDTNFIAGTRSPSTIPSSTRYIQTPTNSTVAATTSQRPGLITRTSDAIYKALTGYFSHDDGELDGEQKEFGAKLTTMASVRSSRADEPTTTARSTDRGAHLPLASTRHPPMIPHSTAPPIKAPAPTASSRTTAAKTSASTSIKPRPETTTGHNLNQKHHQLPSVKPANRSTTGAPHSETQLHHRTSQDGIERNSATSKMIGTVTESSRSKLTTAPHLDLEFSDQNYERRPSDGVPSTTTRATSSRGTTQRVTSTTSSHQTMRTTPTIAPTAATITARTTTTTARPQTKQQTTTPTPTTTTPLTTSRPSPAALKSNESASDDPKSLLENSTSSLSTSVHLFGLLNQAFLSIRSELMLLNRTTRLARDQIHGGLEESTTMQVERETDIEGVELNPSEPKLSDRLSNLSRTIDGEPNEGAISNRQQVTSREDILLLCKLLHKHLESGPNGTNMALDLRGLTENLAQSPFASRSEINSSATSTSTAVPIKVNGLEPDASGDYVDQKWLVDEPRSELSDQLHGSRLLETLFSLEPLAKVADSELNRHRLNQSGSAYEEAGIRLLTDLFNLGHRKKLTLMGSGSDELENGGGDPSRGVSLKVWSKTLTEGRGGRLKLAYWLLEPTNIKRLSRKRFKVLELSEAQELIDQLDHSLVQQVVNDTNLVRPTGILVAAYRSDPDSWRMPQPPPPRVIDDHLISPSGGVQGEGKTSTLQLFVDRLTSSSFSENLHLYLILAVVTLFIIVMCFAVPALCCKCMVSSSQSRFDGTNPAESNRRGARRMRSAAPQGAPKGRRQQLPARGFYKSMDPLRESITSISQSLAAQNGAEANEAKLSENPAIWRKLSNSTTTMTKDEIRTLEDDGQLDLVCGADDELGPRGRMSPNKSKFEWYTFEDNKEQTIRRQRGEPPSSASVARGQKGILVSKPTQTTMLVRDQTKVTKSVQTYALDDDKPELVPDSENETPLRDEHLSLAYRDRLETRNSNTLTKSELVMLKEKLIPIGRQRAMKHDECQPAPQHQRIDHDYVNTAADNQQRQSGDRPQTATRGPSRHIDSSSVDSANGGQARYQSTAMPADERPRRRATELGERAPTMRYLELPVGTQGKVDAIKQELTKVEERDLTNIASLARRSTSSNQPYSDIVGTYKRYDVI